jgi:hypothetical protein
MELMRFDETIQAKDIEKFFEGEIPEKVKKHVVELNLKFRKISDEEYLSQKNEYLKFLDETIIPSGPKRKKIWQNGWGQNLEDALKNGISRETLLPYYYKRGVSLMRYKGEYILPEDDRFEQKFLSIIQYTLAAKYFKDYDNIYELGCGPCHNIFEFSQQLTNKIFYTSDWVEPTVTISNLLEKNKHELGIGSHNFRPQLLDLFNPNLQFELKPNSVVLTFGSMEQLGENFDKLLEFFLNGNCNNFIHMEPILELYDREYEIDDLAYRYSIKRNYLIGFLPKLEELQKQSRIKIHSCQRIIGSAFHDGWTFLRWEKL